MFNGVNELQTYNLTANNNTKMGYNNPNSMLLTPQAGFNPNYRI
jgi:hypothetical protein